MARQRAHRRAVLPMGDMFSVGGCDCSCNPSGQTVTIKGCNSFVFTNGQSVQVWNHSGGTLLYTDTTNSSGQISVPVGTYWFIPSNGRFAGQNYTVTTGTNTITFAAATGYACSCSNLWFAIPTTVYWTDSDVTLKPITYNTTFLIWNSVTYNMSGSIAGSGIGGGGCTSGSGHPSLSIGFSCTGGPQRSWGECICGGGVYLYEILGVGCGSSQPGSYGASFGFSSTTNPPFSFSGPLPTYQQGNLADPVTGNVTISE